MDNGSAIDPEKIRQAVERVLALKSEVSALREQMEREHVELGHEQELRESLEKELRELRSAADGGNGSSKHMSQDLIKKLIATMPDKLAGILRRKGEAFIPGLGRFLLRYGPEGSVVDFDPDAGFIEKL